MIVSQPVTVAKASANKTSVPNAINNGGFTAFKIALESHKRDSLYDVIDPRLYRRVSTSFNIPTAAGTENFLGYWDIFGVASSVVVNPITFLGDSVLSPDGGNVIEMRLSQTGKVQMAQAFPSVAALRNRSISVTLSTRKGVGSLKLSAYIKTDTTTLPLISTQTSATSTFRRFNGTTLVPFNTKTAELVIEFSGSSGASAYLAAVAVAFDASGAPVPFTPSTSDIAVPSGTVFLFTGTGVVPGFQDITEGQNCLICLVPGTGAIVASDGSIVSVAGSDTHDHDPARTQDTLEENKAAAHFTDSIVPEEDQVSVHTDIYGTVQKYPKEQPVTVLGINHTHKLDSSMTSIPPSFPVRILKKI